MELQEFISKALLSIVNGVDDANSENNCFELSGSKHSRGDSGAQVQFDLMVIAEQSNESGIGKGAGLKINIFSAGINSSEKDLSKSQLAQRMQFNVFINEKNIKQKKVK